MNMTVPKQVLRLPDWRARLVDYLNHCAHEPFIEGQFDCALFFADAVAAMTGKDHAKEFRGRYTTTRGGIRILKKAGFSDHIALAKHHCPEKPVAFANEGDGAVIPTPDGPALGVVQGENVYVRTPERLGLVPLLSADRALTV